MTALREGGQNQRPFIQLLHINISDPYGQMPLFVKGYKKSTLALVSILKQSEGLGHSRRVCLWKATPHSDKKWGKESTENYLLNYPESTVLHQNGY